MKTECPECGSDRVFRWFTDEDHRLCLDCETEWDVPLCECGAEPDPKDPAGRCKVCANTE